MVAGLVAGAIAVFKLVPLVWLPAIVRAGRGLALGVVLGLFGILIPSLVLAPQAWLDYVRVLPNLVNGDARYAQNLAPAVVALNLGSPGVVVDVIRVAAIALAMVFLVASLRLSPTARGWPAAVACVVVAGLLLPAALWYHYLVQLLPLAVFAWVRADGPVRALLVSAWILIAAGMTIPVLAFGGTVALCAILVTEFWPKARHAPEAAAPVMA